MGSGGVEAPSVMSFMDTTAHTAHASHYPVPTVGFLGMRLEVAKSEQVKGPGVGESVGSKGPWRALGPRCLSLCYDLPSSPHHPSLTQSPLLKEAPPGPLTSGTA